MLYRKLADFVMVVHWLTAIFVLTGAFFALKSLWVATVHVPLVFWVCLAAVMRWNCPLTPLENRLRRAAGDRGYEGGFIEHYLRFLPNTDRKDGASIAVSVGVMNVVLYGIVLLINQIDL